MRFLFKSRPRLSTLLSKGYTDIHSHLLPGLDDGAKNIEDTIGLLRRMREIGIDKCITTPHIISGVWENDRHSIFEAWESTKPQLPDPLQNLLAGAAAEYMLDNSFLDAVRNEDLLCLKDRYLLVELPYMDSPIALDEILFEIKLKGYQPVLAHPERYLYFQGGLKKFDLLKKAGCLFQLNLLSTVGYYGPDVLRLADQLLAAGFIDFVGSDIHHKPHIEAFGHKIKIRSSGALQNAIENNSIFSH